MSQVKDMAASVRDRLLKLSRERGQDFQMLLTHYALERFLYRLSVSPHAENFVLKGALRFMAWTAETRRPTRDLDMTGYGEESPEWLGKTISEICWIEDAPEDGLAFDAGMVKVEAIREDQVYQGLRVKLIAHLGNIPITLQIDVGFGDAVTPQPEVIEYPSLLGMPAPRIRAYPKETIVAEKLQAMVALGIANSRMKDFYDIWTMSKVFSFEGPVLVRAIRATFQRRRTALPSATPTALDDEFAQDAGKNTQWTAFIRKNQLEIGGADLPSVIADLREFLLPPLTAATTTTTGENFRLTWQAAGAWR